jgi:hypothetical membrane protein
MEPAMTSLNATHFQHLAEVRIDGTPRVSRRLFLIGGIVASLLYVATDILGGLRYEGYSFSSQMVSELMAVGAPSERFVDPLFLCYGALMLLFGIAVMRAGAGRNRRLCVAGAALIAYAVAGLTGPTLFEMHPRGTPNVSDMPHIALTGVISTALLLAMGMGAFAFGARFRTYTFATIAVVVVFGALAGFAGRNMATGQLTPGFGFFERVNIYATMLWIALLAVALLQRRRTVDGVAA